MNERYRDHPHYKNSKCKKHFSNNTPFFQISRTQYLATSSLVYPFIIIRNLFTIAIFLILSAAALRERVTFLRAGHTGISGASERIRGASLDTWNDEHLYHKESHLHRIPEHILKVEQLLLDREIVKCRTYY